jgi:phage FluMu protein Com
MIIAAINDLASGFQAGWIIFFLIILIAIVIVATVHIIDTRHDVACLLKIAKIYAEDKEYLIFCQHCNKTIDVTARGVCYDNLKCPHCDNWLSHKNRIKPKKQP